MANIASIPSLSGEGNLSRYLDEIRKFPMLSADEEFMLAKAWAEREDTQAAHKMVTSHLRLVAKIAMGYRGYGLPVSDLISEGNVGMMQAVKRFVPMPSIHQIIPLWNQISYRAASSHIGHQVCGVAKRHAAIHAARPLIL